MCFLVTAVVSDCVTLNEAEQLVAKFLADSRHKKARRNNIRNGRVKKKPEVEYECEPLFISEVKANVGYGALVTTGPHLVLDNTAYTAMTYQPNVFLGDSSGSLS